jgi:hypothetical protein
MWHTKLKKGLVQPIISTKTFTHIETYTRNDKLLLKFSENVSSNLDSIIAEGNSILSLNRSYQDWVANSSLSSTHRVEDKEHKIHSEDLQIYSNISNVKYQEQSNASDRQQVLFRWPVTTHNVNGISKKRNRDHAWDLIYSDGVSIDEFYQSQSIFPKKHMIKATEAARQYPLNEMIQKSWERAVSIVSNTIPPSHDDNKIKAANTDISSQLSHKKAIAISLCKEHGIFFNDFHENSDSYYCVACNKHLQYKSNKEVTDHIFGSEDEEGCCWNLIRQPQIAAAKSVMEREVTNIVDSLLHPVLMKVKQQARKDENAPSHVGQRTPFNWKDICNIWREAITNADTPNEIDSKNLRNFDKTMKVCDTSLPIPLNYDIVQIAEQKLVNRYAKSNK